MKLLVVSHACSTAVNQQFYADVQALTGWDISILTPSNWINEYGKPIFTRWESFKGEIIGKPVWKSGDIILHAYRASMKRLLRQVNPDVIYMNHEPYAVATAQVFWANKRSINKPIGFYSCQNIRKNYPPPFKWTQAMVFRQSRFAFPITQAVDDVHRANGYTGPSTILPFGVDPALHKPVEDVEATRRALGASDGQVLIGFIGRIVEEKGLATLLKGLADLRDLNWRLAIVGAGPYDEALKKLAGELSLADRIHFHGFVPHPEAPRYLSAFDITVLPSETRKNWKEQFGRVIIESLACGTPVLGSNSGEIGSLVRKTGGGRVFEEGNSKSLASELGLLISDADERQRLADAGRAAVMSDFTNAALIARFADTIRAASET